MAMTFLRDSIHYHNTITSRDDAVHEAMMCKWLRRQQLANIPLILTYQTWNESQGRRRHASMMGRRMQPEATVNNT